MDAQYSMEPLPAMPPQYKMDEPYYDVQQSSKVIPPHMASAQSRTLAVDFTWKKFKALVSDSNSSNPNPLYTVSFQMVSAPHLRFKSTETGQQIGTGTVHAFSINPDYQLHGAKHTLKAQKRLVTNYTHMSSAFSDTDTPVKMTWTGEVGLKTWSFICVDENQVPVAKFSANLWAVKKLAKIELMGPKALDDAVRDEIVVVGFTLFYCMYLRANNIFNLFGSAFLRPDKEGKAEKGGKE
ncbi:hypothetical protein N7462_011350 [Penicillium macrosclerotiorum]|uniref:uncharacterized protein n=1 Tax=Penicillium macrosclerotiorum TaxID=303699 RepID=UPI002546658E|nr:uncharacterized protein N7462_011350 [Penicillium macrosclerotiorum]KAJ5666941.1 hypothetical protein N7462_011350 [Penicillium macrosclerotiorum]